MSKDNPISSALSTYRNITVNPTVNAGLIGTAAFGVGTLGWNRIMETMRSLLRRPVSMMTDMSVQEFDQEMENIKNSKKWRWILPSIAALGAGGTALLASYRPNEAGGGLLAWNAPPKPLNTKVYRGYTMPGSQNVKTASAMQKLANMMATDFNGFVAPVDFSQIIPARETQQKLVTNDPYVQNNDYLRRFETSIFSKARQDWGADNVPLSVIQTTAADKFNTKFGFDGVRDVFARTVMANTAATYLTKAIGTMANLDDATQKNIVEGLTWGATVDSLVNFFN